MSGRARPSTTRDSEFFQNALDEHRLDVQRCSDCGELRFPPLPSCPHCGSVDWEAEPMSGQGSVYSFVVPRSPTVPYMPDDYIVALVELAEGPRLVTNLLEVDPSDVTIGMPVELCFEQLDDDTALPQFRPAAAIRDALS